MTILKTHYAKFACTLLEADVALPVVREFIQKVKESAVGQDVNKSLTPGPRIY